MLLLLLMNHLRFLCQIIFGISHLHSLFDLFQIIFESWLYKIAEHYIPQFCVTSRDRCFIGTNCSEHTQFHCEAFIPEYWYLLWSPCQLNPARVVLQPTGPCHWKCTHPIKLLFFFILLSFFGSAQIFFQCQL
jgi:hypothetical protein